MLYNQPHIFHHRCSIPIYYIEGDEISFQPWQQAQPDLSGYLNKPSADPYFGRLFDQRFLG